MHALRNSPRPLSQQYSTATTGEFGSFCAIAEPQLAHTYSECARIWNPVHTDRAVALAAGLPDIILHGSATLALAVSSIVAHEAGEEPARISRIGGEFRGMVFLPSTLRVSVGAPQESAGALVVPFEAFNDRGEAALRHGHITLTQAAV